MPHNGSYIERDPEDQEESLDDHIGPGTDSLRCFIS